MIQKTFKKSERLAKKKLIQELFSKGSSFYLDPLKVIYLQEKTGERVNQILISVPKRNHKKAVVRNLLKRRIREAYRNNKHLLDSKNNLRIAYIYVAKDILDYSIIENKMIQGLKRINEQSNVDEKK